MICSIKINKRLQVAYTHDVQVQLQSSPVSLQKFKST